MPRRLCARGAMTLWRAKETIDFQQYKFQKLRKSMYTVILLLPLHIDNDLSRRPADGMLARHAAEELVGLVVFRAAFEDVLAALDHPVQDLLAPQLPGVAVSDEIEVAAVLRDKINLLKKK